MKKTISMALAVAILSPVVNAQPPNLDSIKQELFKINKVFDSSRYLGFDVNIIYTSDTVYGKFDYEEMSGKYILSDRNVYYKMGSTEYVQNDSFTYNIYHDEQMLMMTKDSISAKSSLFPLKEFVDSIITGYAASYTINLRVEEDSKVIEFIATDTIVPYKKFAIYYAQDSYYPDKFEMFFKEGYNNPDTISSTDVLWPTNKRITIIFSNYNQPGSLDIFDDANYVLFDRMRKKYRPSEKFKAYKFIANGVDGEDDDDSIELYPPPDDNQ